MSYIETILQEIDQRIKAKHLLNHPFYQAWTHGTLSLDALRDYSKQYYQHVAAFPTYLSALHARIENRKIRKQILQNLIDEEAGTPDHPELWQQFAASLGVSKEELERTESWDETKSVIKNFRSICRNGLPEEAVAALYAYESQIPEISESKIDGLKKHYGFTDEKGYEYFSVHQEADVEHSATERSLLGEMLSKGEGAACLNAVDKTLDAMWGLLSGVCRRHQISC